MPSDSYYDLDIGIFSSIDCLLLLLVIALMIWRRQFRTAHHRLVLLMFFCTLINWTTQTILMFYWSSSYCYAFAFLSRFLKTCIFFWEVSIAINLTRMVVFLQRRTLEEQIYYHWLVWSACFFLGFLPMTTRDLAAPPYCWIPLTFTGKVWRMLVYDGPLIITCLVIVLLYLLILRAVLTDRMTNGGSNRTGPTSVQGFWFLITYPIIFVICWIPTVIYDIYVLSTGTLPHTLFSVALYCELLHPIFSVVAYCWPMLREAFRSCAASLRARKPLTRTSHDPILTSQS